MVSLVMIMTAVFGFVCAHFFYDTGCRKDAIAMFVISSILFLVGIPMFINYLLEVLRWIF